jgi:NADH-quinone oxidoreductase subunit G
VFALHENLLKEAGFTEEEVAAIPFLVSQHILANPTAAAAKVVLPGAGFAEKRGSMINATGRLQRLNAALNPPGEARDDWEILRDLATSCGGDRGPYLIEDLFSAMAAEIPVFDGQSLGRIGDAGVQIYQTGVTIPLLERERERVRRGEING